MNNVSNALYGGRHQKVLDHPDHRAGVNHGTMTVTAVAEIAPSVVRVIATLDHDGDAERWRVTNPAIRLELPDVKSDAMVSRVYTVRDYRESSAGVRELDVDIVRHEGDSPVMRWLAAAQPGIAVRILGPRPHFCPAIVSERPAWMFADETAIPALATILRDWVQPGVRGEAWVETPDEAVFTELEAPEGVALHWLPRPTDEPPGTTGRLVAAALEASSAFAEPVTVWAGGEHQEMRQIRDHFRHDRGMDRTEVQVFGYWRRGRTSSQVDEARLQRYEEALKHSSRMAPLDDFDVQD